MRSITIIIPHLPYAELNPNNLRSSHWTVRSQWSKIAREEVGWLCKAQWHDDEPMTKARISYDFQVKDKRKRDLDNLLAMCKAWQDGLIDVGVLRYDDAKHLEIGHITLKQSDAEQSIVTVEEIN